MSDAQFIPALIKLGSSVNSLDRAELIAGQELLAVEHLTYPMDGCAITQSELLRMAGIEVPFTFLALGLDELLQTRGWSKIPVGQQQAGDLGSTCFGGVRHPLDDHIYLVLLRMNDDEMLVADNQAKFPHQRRASGKPNETPTDHFLRAPGPTKQ